MEKQELKSVELVEIETDSGSVSIPSAPDYLNGEGEEMWYRICSRLSDMRLLTDSAYPQVADYCFNWQIFCFNASEVSGEDTPGVEVYSTGSRGLSANYKAATEARKAMVVFERYWGLNPAALSKIVLPEKPKDEDEFDI